MHAVAGGRKWFLLATMSCGAALLVLPHTATGMPVAAGAAGWQNVTVWHVHPSSNRHGDLANMNSGDAGGDMFFSSRDRWLPLACRNDTGFREPGECHMTEVADPTILAVSQVVVEMDTDHTGNFRACNLEQDPHILFPKPTNYSCAQGHSCALRANASTCTYSHSCVWQNGKCENKPCARYTSEGAAECAERKCAWKGGACTEDTTTLGHETVEQFFGPGKAPSSSWSRDPAPWDWWKQGLVRLFGGGMWYSTLTSGECKGPTHEPSGCSWRVVAEVKRVHKVCADASIGSFVQSADTRGCFEACSPAERTNSSSACWVNCFFQTMLGPNATSSVNDTGAMAQSALMAAWQRPFASSDASKGGCAAI